MGHRRACQVLAAAAPVTDPTIRSASRRALMWVNARRKSERAGWAADAWGDVGERTLSTA
jgi:hypothetical protein